MTQNLPTMTPETLAAARRKSVDDAVFDKKAMAIGLCIAILLALLMVVWRVAVNTSLLAKSEPKEFAFDLNAPKQEEFTIRDPGREFVKESAVDRVDLPSVPEEKPNIHMTRVPTSDYVATEVIQSPNVADFNTQKSEFKIDASTIGVVAKNDVQFDDAPERIDYVSETVSFPIQPIAAVTDAPADMFRYPEPSPRDKPQYYLVATGPRPGRPMKSVVMAYGDQNAPSMGELGPVNINLFGTGDVFRQFARTGGVRAKSSVDSALHWLAVHQGADGLWHCEELEGDKSGSLASTAFSCLAFMGGGHTTRKGEYSRNVLRGLDAIMKHQKPTGHIQMGGENLYTHAICTIALAEAYGRARDERVGAAAQKAIAFCENSVNADGGWRYAPKAEASDMSVTAWFVQAIKTAKIASLKSDHTIYSQAQSFVDSVTDQGAGKDSNGSVTYMYQADQSYPGNGHPALTAAGMMIRQFTGMGVKNHLLVKGAELTRKHGVDWRQKDFYMWYYSTYAMHNMGGEYRIWWNQKIRDCLIEHQSKDGDKAGSWDPKGDKWGERGGGRTYCTALGALCLEVYYRYSEALNAFGVAPDLDELGMEP